MQREGDGQLTLSGCWRSKLSRRRESGTFRGKRCSKGSDEKRVISKKMEQAIGVAISGGKRRDCDEMVCDAWGGRRGGKEEASEKFWT